MLKIETQQRESVSLYKGKEITVYAFYFALFSLQERGLDNKKKVFGIPLYYKYTDFHFVFCIQSYCFLLFRFTHILVMGHE